jgi:hypothetical protein
MREHVLGFLPRRVAQREARRLQADRERERIAAAFARYDSSPDIAARLESEPAPRGRSSAASWLAFVRRHGGHASKMRAARLIERAENQRAGQGRQEKNP